MIRTMGTTRPVRELGSEQYVCSRCGIEGNFNANRPKPDQCPDCRWVESPPTPNYLRVLSVEQKNAERRALALALRKRASELSRFKRPPWGQLGREFGIDRNTAKNAVLGIGIWKEFA